MPHRLCLPVLALLLALTLPATAETWRLDYATQSRIERRPTPTEPGEVTDRSGVLHVYLSPTRFATLTAEGEGMVYDFAAQTLTFANPQGARTVPLIADLAFRVMEIQNVIRIERALRSAGITKRDEIRDLIDIETRFTLPWPGSVEDLPAGESAVTIADDGQRAWVHNGKAEAHWEPRVGDPQTPDSLNEAIQLWLLYTGKIHPDFLAAVTAEPEIPAALSTSWRDGVQRFNVKMQLTAVDPTATWPQLPAPEAADKDDGLGLWLYRFETQTDLPPRTTPAQFAARISEAADREPLDALLAVFAQAFHDGKHPGPQVQALSKRFADQPRIIAFREAHAAPQQDPGPDGLAARMAALDRTGLQYAYILDIFQANGLAESGRPDEALALLGRVIAQNPYLTGVWNDVGQIWLRRYDTFRAWRCFAAARSITPDHPMLAGIGDFERKLRTDFPQFFLTPAPVPVP